MADKLNRLSPPPKKKLKLEDESKMHVSENSGQREGSQDIPLPHTSELQFDMKSNGIKDTMAGNLPPMVIIESGDMDFMGTDAVLAEGLQEDLGPKSTTLDMKCEHSVDLNHRLIPNIVDLEQEMIRGETAVGITEYASQGSLGFRGVLKKR